jgi:hypothetical protein
LRDESEERLVLEKAVKDRWRTHQIGDRFGNTTDKSDFRTKIFLVNAPSSAGGGGRSSLTDNSGGAAG